MAHVIESFLIVFGVVALIMAITSVLMPDLESEDDDDEN